MLRRMLKMVFQSNINDPEDLEDTYDEIYATDIIKNSFCTY